MLPCPFCGMEVDLEESDTLHMSGIFWRETTTEGIRSYHSLRDRLSTDSACWVMNCPTVSGGCGVTINADSREEAIELWNRRVNA
jgi:hypothetical protein